MKSFAAAPDSVSIFTYAIPQDTRKGLHIAYSTDGKSWKAIGQDQSFVSSDFGTWGREKQMIHPSVIIPCSSIAVATFMKPAMFAPFT